MMRSTLRRIGHGVFHPFRLFRTANAHFHEPLIRDSVLQRSLALPGNSAAAEALRIAPGSALIGKARLLRLSTLVGTAGVLLAIAPIFVTGFTLLHLRGLSLADSARELNNLDIVLADQVDRTIQSVDLVLRAVVEDFQDQRGPWPKYKETPNLLLKARYEGVPQIIELTVLDAQAGVRFTTSNSGHSDIDAANARSLLGQRPQGAFGVSISPPILVSKNATYVFISRNLVGTDGAFCGLVVASVDPAYFERLFQDIDLGPSSVVKLQLGSGAPLARLPHAVEFISNVPLGRPVFEQETHRFGRGDQHPPDAGNDAATLVATRTLKTYPLVITIERSRNSALQHWSDQASLLGVLTVGIITAIAATTGVFVVRLRRSEALQALLRTQSLVDPLTGVYNRRFLDICLAREVSQAALTADPLCVMMIDLDHFKRFNERFGHGGGDDVLRAIARTLRKCVRASDLVCRYGGEEFTILMPCAGADTALQRTQFIMDEVRSLRVVSNGNELPTITLSIGIALFPQHARSSELLIQAADKALYEAKSTGRDKIVIYRPPCA